MAATNMDREQHQLEAGLLSKSGYEDKTLAQPSNISSTPRKSTLSLWKLALIAFGIYGLVYLTTAKVWPNRKPCMHNAIGSLVHGQEGTIEDQVKESAVTPKGLNEIASDFKFSRARIIEKRQATASTPNSAASSQQNTVTSQAAPSTSQQPTSSAQPTSAAPTSSERPVTTTQQPTSSAQPTTSQRPSENTSSTQASTSARPTTSASQATSSNPQSSQQTSSAQPTSSAQKTSQSQSASSSSRQATTSVGTSTTARGSSSLPSSSLTSAPATSSTATTASSSTTTSSEETSTTSSSSSRQVSSSPVPQTFTRTLASGGVTVVTSTSWVEVVPASGTPSSDNNPDLQGMAGRVPLSIAMSLATAFFAGFLLV